MLKVLTFLIVLVVIISVYTLMPVGVGIENIRAEKKSVNKDYLSNPERIDVQRMRLVPPNPTESEDSPSILKGILVEKRQDMLSDGFYTEYPTVIQEIYRLLILYQYDSRESFQSKEAFSNESQRVTYINKEIEGLGELGGYKLMVRVASRAKKVMSVFKENCPYTEVILHVPGKEEKCAFYSLVIFSPRAFEESFMVYSDMTEILCFVHVEGESSGRGVTWINNCEDGRFYLSMQDIEITEHLFKSMSLTETKDYLRLSEAGVNPASVDERSIYLVERIVKTAQIIVSP